MLKMRAKYIYSGYQCVRSIFFWQENHNLWFHVYPGYSHSGFAGIARMWSNFKILSQDRQ